jgi:hypothetical protein
MSPFQRPATVSDAARSTTITATRPLERAQLVWRRAVTLSDAAEDRDPFEVTLDLLRTAHHGPSTMLHALAYGRAQLIKRPDDKVVREAVHLLEGTIAWLGREVDESEVGNRP